MALFSEVAFMCSKATTEQYSTSFASAIRLLHKDFHAPVHAIYGLVRFADEIVDTFHEYDKEKLLLKFKSETFIAIEEGISLNPILQSFQTTVRRYNIDVNLIEAFFRSMEMDLKKQQYLNEEELDQYIYGSAEVVGLMCLYIFCEGNKDEFERLKPAAQALGAAFQKVNFLRDLKADYSELNRVYFPGLTANIFNDQAKKEIEENILCDFKQAFQGIKQLPIKARFGVYVAYRYYFSLFRKIQKLQPEDVMSRRIRVPNHEKMMILCQAGFENQFRLI